MESAAGYDRQDHWVNPEAAPDDTSDASLADTSWLRRLAQLHRLFTQLPTKVRVVLVALLMVVEVAIGWRIGPSAALPAYLFFGAVAWFVALSDAVERRIPNAVLLSAYPTAAALLVVASAAEHQWYGLLRGAIGMLALSVFYLILALLRPGELGLGDVKLSGFIGLSLGWLGWHVLTLGAIAGPALGALGAAVLLLVVRSEGRTTIPFAPFMLLGAVIGILVR